MKALLLSCVGVIVICLGCNGPVGCNRPVDEVTALLLILPREKDGVGDETPQASGEVIYCRKSAVGFEATISLAGLKESQSYVLALNTRPGGQADTTGWEPYNDEYFVNMKVIRTKDDGSYTGEFSHALNPSTYDVKFLVKDMSRAQKVALHSDYLSFKVSK